MPVTSKPKIAIFSLRNTYRYGGVLSSLKTMYDFCQLYFEPTVFFLGFSQDIATSLRTLKFSSSSRSLSYFGMNCIEVGARWAFWEPNHYTNTLKTWEYLLNDFKYCVAASGTCIVAHPLALLNKKYGLLISTPYNEDRKERIKELRGVYEIIDKLAHEKMTRIEKSILTQASFIWALSNYSLNQFKTITPLPHNKVIRCGHPLDCSKLPTLNQKKEKFIIALGRFNDPRKNIAMLLRTFEKIFQKMPDATLYIVGQKPSDERLAPFTHLPSFNNIIFTGQVGEGDLSYLLHISSLMLITSHQEGFGIAGIEALLHGIPIVSTLCGGPEDYVVDNFTGYLVNIDDDYAMAEKALSILSTPIIRYAMASNAQEFVRSNFSKEKIHSFFKQGFISMFPELSEWFTTIDVKKSTNNSSIIKNYENSCY